MDEAGPTWDQAGAGRPGIWAGRPPTGPCRGAVRRASRWFRLGSEFLDFGREEFCWVVEDLPHTYFLLSCIQSMVETKTYPEIYGE